MPIKSWFPTLIYEGTLNRPGDAFSRDLLADCAKLRAHDDAGRRWSATHYPSGYTSYASQDKLHRTFSTFGELEKRITRHARRFARRLDMNLAGAKLAMTDCWINIMPRHATHSLHLHPLSVLSGTYYLKTPRGCARLRFEDPRLERFMAAPPKVDDCRPENRQHVTYDVNAGTVLLWESWLRHEVQPNQIDAERISVSFNYNWL